MKLQKVMIALGLSTCLIGSQVLSAIAQEQSAVQQEAAAETVAQNAAEDSETVSEPAVQTETVQTADTGGGSEPEITDTEASGETSGTTSDSGTSAETPGTETSGTEETDTESNADPETAEGEVGSTDQESGDNAAGEEFPEAGEEGTGDEDQEVPETGEDADQEDSQETGEDVNQDGQESGDDTESGTGAEDSGNADREEQEESSGPQDTADRQPSAPAENYPAAQPSGGNQYKITPDSMTSDAVLNMGNFLASNKFPDNRDKIKYNVDLPLDNIPSFITQEMIIGALKCQDETGYPASVTIAQIIQESGYGKYGPGGEDGEGLSYLAYQYNNLFGIKGKGPAGSVDMKTGEQTSDGISYTITAGFRVYNTYTECIEDRAELLDEVYKDLTFGVEDANTFAIKVGSRWATDVDYGLTLIRIMERYDLYRLDEMTLGEFSDMLGTFVNPCPGAVLTSEFGYRTAPTAGASTNHKGIDLGTGEYNIPTYAAAEGTVTFAGEAGSAGLMIVIDHGDGLVTKYMHHDKIYVEEGDEIEKGQQIGLSGTTGVSTGNHLHFQVEQDGCAVNPLDYLDIEKNQ